MPITIGDSTIGMSSNASIRIRPRNRQRASAYAAGIATTIASTAASVAVHRLKRTAARTSGSPSAENGLSRSPAYATCATMITTTVVTARPSPASKKPENQRGRDVIRDHCCHDAGSS